MRSARSAPVISKDSRCHNDSDRAENYPTEFLAALFDTADETVAELETDQAHTDANRPDDHDGHQERDVLGTQSEPDHQVVDTERGAGSNEGDRVLRRIRVFALALGLHERVCPDDDDHPASHPIAR
jgi:hypothetical protein